MKKNNIETRIADLNTLLQETSADFQLEPITIMKDTVKEGYALKSAQSNASPVVYPDETWDTMTDQELVAYLISQYESIPSFSFTDILDKETVLARVLPRLRPGKTIPDLQKAHLAYKEYLDMAVSFYVPLSDQDSEFEYCCQISDPLLDNQSITIEELFTRSTENITNHIKIINPSDSFPMLPPAPMRIITTQDLYYGAASILSSEIFDLLIKELGEECFILPSSIHECIAVTQSTNTGQEWLNAVKHINHTEIEEKDFLSDNVYLYQDGKLTTLF